MSFNLCNLPPWVIASRHFQDNPRPIEVQGVRQANSFLFRRLDTIESSEERGAVFNDYMSVKFQLHHWQGQSDGARRSLKNSYLRFLRGWMMDSSSVEGAVLKGWVESRMGLPPTFHRKRIGGIHSEEYLLYSIDRMKGSERTNAINSQLDLLYEYTQYELSRRHGSTLFVDLYRGIYDAAEHDVLTRLGKREQIVRLNNLSSFTSDEEKAWEFGFTVWRVRVPLPKIFFSGDILPSSILKGEAEFIVLGGEYLVTQIPCTI